MLKMATVNLKVLESLKVDLEQKLFPQEQPALLTWNIHPCSTLKWKENMPSLCLSDYILSFFLEAIQPKSNRNDNALLEFKGLFFFSIMIQSSAHYQFDFYDIFQL